MKKYYIITLIILAVACLFSAAPVVSNVAVSPETGRVVINYDLAADGQCQVMVLVSADEGANYNIYPSELSGHVGDSVTPGNDKEIIWHPASDNVEVGDQYKLKVIARDNPIIPTNPLSAEEFVSFIKITGGTFNNGTADVTISDFYMSKYEVTQAEYQAVMGSNPAQYYGVGNDYPVYYVTWFDAVKYCNIRSLQEGLNPCYNYNNEGTGPNDWSSGWNDDSNHTNFAFDISANGYRLPTEMEWMYAAKGGNQEPATGYNQYAGTNVEAELTNYAWYDSNSGWVTHTVGTKEPNQLGLYDMSGNVWEWCWDIYGSYSSSAQTDPVGPATGSPRVQRGGSWGNFAVNCRVAIRTYNNPSVSSLIGFRLARSTPVVAPQVVSDPVISPAGGSFDEAQTITITCETEDVDIYYSLDGTDPDQTSTLYLSPFNLASSATVKAKAYKEDWQESEIVSEIYEINIISAPEGFVLVEGGTFTMGRTTGSGYSNELPTHQVTLSSFYIGKYEVTQAEYQAVMGSNPSYYSGSDKPVEKVTWYNAVEYCNARSIQEGLTPCYNTNTWACDFSANGYRLPTEAEWEYAARGGTNDPDYLYSGSDDINSVAWYSSNSGSTTHNVGTKEPKQLGLYDMSGNVWEWCNDWYGSYSSSAQTDPVGPATGFSRVLRGGSWYGDASSCRVARRSHVNPSSSSNVRGFRLARSTPVVAPQVVSDPVISPAGGSFDEAQTITITCETEDVDIYYSLDGTDPDQTSTLYLSPFNLASSATVKARAYKEDWQESQIASADYVINSDFVLVEGRTFHNGTADVTISDFYMSKYEVTQAEFQAVMGSNPSYFPGSDTPVEKVSWFDAVKYCNIRSLQEGLTPCYNYNNEGTDPNDWSIGWNDRNNHTNFAFNISANGYRLPTEMEWMYAAKGGNQQAASGYNQYSGTNVEAELTNYAWYSANSGSTTHNVGTKEPNQLGIYDMSGNVLEWCWDIYGSYSSSAQTDPVGPATGSFRVLRGGSWYYSATYCRVAYRRSYFPTELGSAMGFRLARSSN